MDGSRPVADPDRLIEDFEVYALSAGGWRAVHTADPELVAEDDDWERLKHRCAIKRHAYAIRAARSGTEAGS